MREITKHLVPNEPCTVSIQVMDDPGEGGASHDYRLSLPDGDNFFITFQNGPVPEAGPNGITIESLIAICIDRLEGFQGGPYPCSENAAALMSLEVALSQLQQRTEGRLARGVEGSNEA